MHNQYSLDQGGILVYRTVFANDNKEAAVFYSSANVNLTFRLI